MMSPGSKRELKCLRAVQVNRYRQDQSHLRVVILVGDSWNPDHQLLVFCTKKTCQRCGNRKKHSTNDCRIVCVNCYSVGEKSSHSDCPARHEAILKDVLRKCGYSTETVKKMLKVTKDWKFFVTLIK